MREVQFRRFDEATDLAFFTALYSSAEVMQYIPSRHVGLTEEGIIAKFSVDESCSLFVVECSLDGSVLGEAGIFKQQDALYNCYELGYILSDAFWGLGYGTLICKRLITYVFTVLHGNRVLCRMYARNIGSVKIAISCGMKLVEALRLEDGEYRLTYALLKEDYIAKK